MNLPLTITDLTDWTISCETSEGYFDNAQEEFENLSVEEAIKTMYLKAVDNVGSYSCSAFFYDNEDDFYEIDAPALITLCWNNEEGFRCNVAFQFPYSQAEYYDLDINNIPMKNYGACELPNMKIVIEKALEFFNDNYPIERYKEEFASYWDNKED